jgi:RNA polymerase sigma-70 factor (ECF subfamily)
MEGSPTKPTFIGAVSPEAFPRNRDSAGRADQVDIFNRLVLAHQETAFSVAYYLLGDAADADDAVQEAFIKAYRHFHLFKGNSFRNWLLTIVKNTCIDEIRRRKRRQIISLNSGHQEDERLIEESKFFVFSTTPEQTYDQIEQGEKISKAISSLPVDQQAAVILVDIHGLQYEEAAEIMGVPLGTVKSRLSRARGQLMKVLASS